MRLPRGLTTLHKKPATLLFLASWLVYGAFIRSADLEAFNLQQMGAESLVEHRTYTLGHSRHPLLQPRGDVFTLSDGKGERLIAAKQPGQFTVSGVAYFAIRAFGMNYERDYVVTSAWVTWLSSSSLAALTVALVFLISQLFLLPCDSSQVALKTLFSLFAAISLGFGTHLFAYAGVAHHDVIATALLTLALFQYLVGRRDQHKRTWLAFGLTIGSIPFFSMLPSLMALTLLAVALVHNRYWLTVLGGAALGGLPLAVFNWHYFGSPFLQANVAGGYQDTFWGFSQTGAGNAAQGAFTLLSDRFSSNLWSYLGLGQVSLWLYAPVTLLGVFALVQALVRARTEPDVRKPARLLFAMVAIQLLYLLNISTIGDCQFGPRYLLPVLPLLLSFVSRLVFRILQHGSRWTWVSFSVCGTLLLGTSIAVSSVGARIGIMQCGLDRWLPRAFWESSDPSQWLSGYPLRPVMFTMALALVLMVILGAYRAHAASPKTR
ncbi:MAG: hypothetical protein KA712_10700 [Myxococcales bacterium]|nr:hypothetical protein [Myxococcales bacterium]